LVDICHQSGGYAVHLTDENLKSIVESESFLSIATRPLPKSQSYRDFDTEFPNALLQKGEGRVAMQRATSSAALTAAAPETGRVKRIIQELRLGAAMKDLDIQIYATQNIDEWRVFMRGPDKTPYANKWWYLIVSFPQAYPKKPPEFRFISVPFHVNISREGRICLNVLEKEYTQASVVFEMLVHIRLLLECPNYDDPIDADKRRLTMTDMKQFEILAEQSASEFAKDSVADWTAQLEAK
jgi:ubiquitin-protein ligase